MKMTRKRVPFVQIANEVLYRNDLSAGAKGLYAYLFSKPDDWDFSADRIASTPKKKSKKGEFKEGRRHILSMLHELEQAGLLVRTKLKTGRMEYHLEYAESQSAATAPRVDKPKSPNSTVSLEHGASTAPISNTDNTSNTEEESNTSAASAAREKEISEIIFLFKDVNPTYKSLFNRPPQRAAAGRLLEQFGMGTLTGMVAYLSISNSARYAPTITTPAQLEQKMGELKAWADKQRSGSGKGKKIINASDFA